MPALFPEVVTVHLEFCIHHAHEFRILDDPIEHAAHHDVSISEESLDRTRSRISRPQRLPVEFKPAVLDPRVFERTPSIRVVRRSTPLPEQSTASLFTPQFFCCLSLHVHHRLDKGLSLPTSGLQIQIAGDHADVPVTYLPPPILIHPLQRLQLTAQAG